MATRPNAVEALALESLAALATDPAPKPLHGTAKSPGVFRGTSQKAKDAAQLAIRQSWIEKTGAFRGTGKQRKPLYGITPSGIAHALEHGEPATLMREILGGVDALRAQVQSLQTEVEDIPRRLDGLSKVTEKLRGVVRPPDLASMLAAGAASASESPTDISNAVMEFLTRHRKRNPYERCTVPALYAGVAEPKGLTIGQFHDALRSLVEAGRVRLHPFTGAAYQLEDGHLALVSGQEIKYYAEPLSKG